MNKKQIWFWVSSCVLLVACVILIVFNVMHSINADYLNSLFGIAIAIFVVSIFCLIGTIKKLFYKFYSMVYSLVGKAEEWSGSRVVSVERAYKTLKVTILIVLSFTLLLLILSLLVE